MTRDELDRPMPALRDDLRLSEGAAASSGEPRWVIQDPVRNRFFQIGWLEFEILLRWGASPREICAEIAAQTALRPEVGQVLEFGRFLVSHQLLRPDARALAQLRHSGDGRRWLTWRWWVHHYLFFRIPLVRPQALLDGLAARLDWLFTPYCAGTVGLLGLLGVLLALRQWDSFAADVVESFTLQGLLSFAVALFIAKTLHELGHAIVATRLGVKVAHMGVAFVVLWPMLYTDTGESWKLRSARQRLAIASAGIVTELSLAGLATLGWALSEPGAVRSAFLYLATTSWILSLGLNASPFMRFDGYFILSDLLDFPNLHERSSALARVSLRRTLLGLGEDWPEPFAPSRRRLLVGFAIATWLYRLVIFVAIAVLVYHFFFKLLGIVLFAVEIWWFIAMPVGREVRYWWARRADVPRSRRRVLVAGSLVLLLLLAVPWRAQIEAFGVARSAHQLRVYAPFPAKIQSIHETGEVPSGATLVALEQPDIDQRRRSSEAGLRGYQIRLAGLIADSAGLEQQAAVREHVRVHMEEGQAARREIARLHLQAPFEGSWVDVAPEWRSGQWIASDELIGVLIDPRNWHVDAYVRPEDVRRIGVGSAARFYPEGQPQPMPGRIVAIAPARTRQLAHPMLAARFGGPLATSIERDALAPSPPVFHVLVALEAPPTSLRETRGTVQLDGERRSVLVETVTRIRAVLLRESGF